MEEEGRQRAQITPKLTPKGENGAQLPAGLQQAAPEGRKVGRTDPELLLGAANCIRLDKIAPKGPKTAHKGRKWSRMDPELLLGAANCTRLDKIAPKGPKTAHKSRKWDRMDPKCF